MGNARFISSTVGPGGVHCNCHHRQVLVVSLVGLLLQLLLPTFVLVLMSFLLFAEMLRLLMLLATDLTLLPMGLLSLSGCVAYSWSVLL